MLFFFFFKYNFLASNTFPYVKKRILVVQEEQYELTPVEVRELIVTYDDSSPTCIYGLSFALINWLLQVHQIGFVFFSLRYASKRSKTFVDEEV